MSESPKSITVSATVNAPIEKVWTAFTQPEHIMQWAFASDDWEAPAATNDLRVGGTFSTTMAAKDGSAQFDFGGTYTEVEPNKLIAYTLGDSRKVSVTFDTNAENTQTSVTETFDTEPTHSEEQQRVGWQAIMDNFKKHAESL